MCLDIEGAETSSTYTPVGLRYEKRNRGSRDLKFESQMGTIIKIVPTSNSVARNYIRAFINYKVILIIRLVF